MEFQSWSRKAIDSVRNQLMNIWYPSIQNIYCQVSYVFNVGLTCQVWFIIPFLMPSYISNSINYFELLQGNKKKLVPSSENRHLSRNFFNCLATLMSYQLQCLGLSSLHDYMFFINDIGVCISPQFFTKTMIFHLFFYFLSFRHVKTLLWSFLSICWYE